MFVGLLQFDYICFSHPWQLPTVLQFAADVSQSVHRLLPSLLSGFPDDLKNIIGDLQDHSFSQWQIIFVYSVFLLSIYACQGVIKISNNQVNLKPDCPFNKTPRCLYHAKKKEQPMFSFFKNKSIVKQQNIMQA